MSVNDKFLTSTLYKRDDEFEQTLRPQRFADFPGQEDKKKQLHICVEAAKKRGEALQHLLLSGPPGLGKTTLAHIIANEMGTNIKTSSGPVIEKPADLAGLLSGLNEGDILFIDEIHRLSMNVEEYLYSAMEDFYIDIILDQGTGSRSIRLDLPRFTLVGATTRQGSISAPMRSRFMMDIRLDYYPPEVLQQIVLRSCRILDIEIDPDSALEIAKRSRGTPRIANKLVRWVRDYAQVVTNMEVSPAIVRDALQMLKIDDDGLDEMDNRFLEVLVHRFNGGPVGIKTLAVALGEEENTLAEVIEPFLIQSGFIVHTRQGRRATSRAFERFGLAAPPGTGNSTKGRGMDDLFNQGTV
ncbi:MAG: Holliday junction branch migration DNA helicase RuvB [Lentisphaerae bacterium]|nr:MAG: Holliday junction branch migration DNA helicase RuvB [Lentisphaerota bacterium]